MGKMIADARLRYGLSQRDLAEMANMQNSHISELETGVRPNPHWRNIVKIAYVLGLSLDELAKADGVH